MSDDGTAFQQFRAGLMAPTGYAFCLMIGVVAGLLLLVGLSFNQERIVGPAGAYLARDASDSDAFATREAIHLAIAPRTTMATPRLFLFGDSIVAQAFANEVALERDLHAATGTTWQASFLTTAAQSTLDEAALVDKATRRQQGVVVLPLSVTRYGYTTHELVNYYRDGRLGFRSKWADDDIRMLGEEPAFRTGIYAIDNRKFIARHLWMDLRALAHQPVPRRVDSYVLPEHINAAILAEQRVGILAALRGPMRDDDVSIRLLANTARRLKARGHILVFAEDPINAAAFEASSDRALYTAYLARSQALAARLGGFYCPLQRGGSSQSTTFADYFHVKDAREQSRLRLILADCVAAAVRGGTPA